MRGNDGRTHGTLEPTGPHVRVLFVAGWGRSGSTLLDRMLGQVPSVCSTGELREIWRRGVVENRSCGCGAPFRECDRWRAVGEEAFGGWDALDVEEVMALRQRLDRAWMPPRLLSAGLRQDPAVARYVEILGRLYRAIVTVTEASTVVDSSKIATHALLLRRIPGLELHVVHLVRDPRGVVFSWQKQMARNDGDGRDEMIRYGITEASARYLYYNALAHGLAALGTPSRLLRYEDLLADPITTVTRTLSFGGVETPDPSLSFLRSDEVELQPDHTVDGNPIRFRHGVVALRRDDEWRTNMRPGSRALASAITFPLTLAYRYPIWAGA
jgi:Sulfotransferase family